MKYFYSCTLVLTALLFSFFANAQNISLNIQTQNSGLVGIGGEVFVEVQINNLDATVNLQQYKIRPRLTVPVTVTIAPSGHTLPPGFTIVSISANQQIITLSNATNELAASSSVSAFIRVIGGSAIAPPLTVQGNLLFSTGVAPGSANGPATAGDISADNSSTSTVEVTNTTPLTLINFNAAVENCTPVLKWTTQNEINTSKFEIEKNDPALLAWIHTGTITAVANSTLKNEYSFIDKNIFSGSSEKIFYRLKIVDRDGQYKYSPIVPVLINCKSSTVSAYPNPVKNSKLFVSITGVEDKASATLLSAAGQVVSTYIIANGTNYLDVSKIANGTYILHITDGKNIDTKSKILIQQ